MPAERIAIFVHPTRDVHRAMDELTGWAEAHGVELVQVAGPANVPRGPIDGAGLALAIGGDGTVLAALCAAAPKSLPVLGVACGSLGALTTVSMPDLPDALDRFFAGEWNAHRIPALEIRTESGETATALNDLVVVRAGGSQVTTTIEVAGTLYGRVSGDGVVAATQLGSSAYSMAAGGPVLGSGAGWVVTPLNAHGGNIPPLVLAPAQRARVTISPGFAGARVEIDGRATDLAPGAFDLGLREDFATLVRLGDAEEHFTGLRRRMILMDSPRLLARDVRSHVAR